VPVTNLTPVLGPRIRQVASPGREGRSSGRPGLIRC